VVRGSEKEMHCLIAVQRLIEFDRDLTKLQLSIGRASKKSEKKSIIGTTRSNHYMFEQNTMG
jgi:hypothetical protein